MGTGNAATGLRTFLIADVRGYTRYTRAHGDQAAARLIERFNAIASDAVTGHGGEVIGAAGDEVVAVFASARSAIRAALEMQAAMRVAAGGGIPAGIGLEAGEAELLPGGYISGALNVAARLCSSAAAGQVLATGTVVSLAGRLDHVDTGRRRHLRFKGLDEPVAVVELQAEAPPPPVAAPASAGSGRRRKLVTAVAVSVLAVAVAALTTVAFVIDRGSNGRAPTIPLDLHGDVAVRIDAAARSATPPAGAGILPAAVVQAGTTAWVADAGSGRIRALSGPRRSILLPSGTSPAAMLAVGPTLWVADAAGSRVLEIDPGKGRLVGTVPTGNGPEALARAGRDIWVADAIDGEVVIRNARTGAKDGNALVVGADPTAMASAGDTVTVSNTGSGTVTVIDRGSRLESTVTLGAGAEPAGVAITDGAGWVCDAAHATLERFHLHPLQSTGQDVTLGAPCSGAVVAAAGFVWVATGGAAPAVTAIDPRRAAVVARYATGGEVTAALGPAAGGVWAAFRSNVASHAFPVLRVASTTAPVRLDPAFAQGRWAREVMALTRDTLLAFRRVPGAGGATLVPDLAAGLPTVSPDGRVYTFMLRRGVRYADGRPVAAQDFKHAIVRDFLLGAPGHSAYAGIQGAASCRRGAAGCRLDGIRVRGDTITFRLIGPDPDFRFKLALPTAAPVPVAVPYSGPSRHVPATGPYRVGSASTRQHLVLVRNPRFHPSAPAAQPAGYPDRIEITSGLSTSRALHSTADLVHLGGLPSAAILGSLTSGTARGTLHRSQLPALWYLYANQRSPLVHGNPLLQRMVARRLNRQAIAAALGGAAVPTCHVLPAGLPGGRTDCLGRLGPPLHQPPATALTSTTVDYPPGATRLARAVGTQLRAVGFGLVSLNQVSPAEQASSPSPFGIALRDIEYASAHRFLDPPFVCAHSKPRAADLAHGCYRRILADAATASSYRAADADLVRLGVWTPLVSPEWVDWVRPGVVDYQFNPEVGVLLDQLWLASASSRS